MDDDSSAAWLMFLYFAALSLTAVGGGIIMLMPELQRFVVATHGWISAEEFVAAYTIAQVAPGPNLTYVTLVGWQVAGWQGALATTLAVLLPTSTVTVFVVRAGGRHAASRLGRAMRRGVAPLAAGFLLATGWVFAQTAGLDWRALLLTAATVLIVLRTRLNPLWLIAMGAGAGLMEWV